VKKMKTRSNGSWFSREVRPLFVVVWWPDPYHHVPQVIGPFDDNEEARAVRDDIRFQQRSDRMAHVVPLDGWTWKKGKRK